MAEIVLHCSCGATWTTATAGWMIKCEPVGLGDREYGYFCHTCGKELFVPLPMPDVQTAVGPEAIDEVLAADGVYGSDEWEEP